MGTAIKHPVSDRVKLSFVFLTSGHSDAQRWASECPDAKNYKWQLNPVWHRMFYSCTHMATVGVKGLTYNNLNLPVSAQIPTQYNRFRWHCCVNDATVKPLVYRSSKFKTARKLQFTVTVQLISSGCTALIIAINNNNNNNNMTVYNVFT